MTSALLWLMAWGVSLSTSRRVRRGAMVVGGAYVALAGIGLAVGSG